MKKEIIIKAIKKHVKDFNGIDLKSFYEELGFDDVYTVDDSYMDYFKSDDYLKSHITENNIEAITNKIITKIDFDSYLITKEIHKISLDYVKNLPNRIKEDLDNNNYDSIITKSRTLVESVCKFIISDETSTKDIDFTQLVKICKEKIGIDTDNLRTNDKESYTGLIKQFEGGLNSIIQALGKLRNSHSDAHGSITRAVIEKRYAVLIANIAIAFSEYLLETFYRSITENE